MTDWDDVRYLLAVAREGSVRAATERLQVNYSTVLRRAAQLQERLGVQMFRPNPRRRANSCPQRRNLSLCKVQL